ncbi:transcriptional regulator [Desulfolithobacter dissulfuricans]|nr:transcriptional regulator [Desulfolithobacter dissulfuricans]
MTATKRQQLMDMLRQEELTSLDISAMLGIPEKEVHTQLGHIRRSLSRRGEKLVVTPFSCQSCGYLFKKRQRLDRPGRCPKCKSSHIRLATFRVG